ncbi:MAG: hypothetical protein ACRCYR_07985 [Phycicoccus sp.]
MTRSNHRSGTAGTSFETHLQSLRDFADELRQQVSALLATKEAVEALAANRALLGHFLEADLLLGRHAGAVDQVRALLAGVEKALVFADRVTDTVADSYERGDADAAAVLGGAGASR